MKTCCACLRVKSLDEFPKRGCCKVCRAERDHQRYLANKTAAIERAASWRRAHPDKHREHQRAYAESDQGRARRREREKTRTRPRGWESAYPDKARAAKRAWARRNPEAVRSYVNARRARLAGATGSHSESDWIALVHRYGGCVYCGSADRLSRDHVVPLSRGGSDLIGNILPACLSCNTSKKDRLLVEWRRRWQARAVTRLPASRLP